MQAKKLIEMNGNNDKNGVYAGFGVSDTGSQSSFNFAGSVTGKQYKLWDNLSGGSYIKDFNEYNLDRNKDWYALDLCEKYNKKSMLKQFHMLTFYFRDSTPKTKRHPKMIKAMLPEQFTYSIGGNWGKPISLSLGDTAQAIFQQTSGGRASLQHSVDTFMVWQSPKRLELVFKIPIFDDSGNDTRINYQEALNFFGGVILPDVDKNGYYERIPGPVLTRVLNYRAEGEKNQRGAVFADKVSQETGKGVEALGGQKPEYDRLTIQVGGVFLIDWCVITDMRVTFPNTKHMVLHNFSSTGRSNHKIHLQPLQAELEIHVSTVQSLTRLAYQSMLYMQEQKKPNENTGNNNIEENQDTWEPSAIPENYGYKATLNGDIFPTTDELEPTLNGLQWKVDYGGGIHL